MKTHEQYNLGLSNRNDYEISPPTDADYTGPRFEYAFPNKPVFPYNSLESCPNGAIYGTFKRGATSMHGTIQYPFELDVKEVNQYNLTDFQRTKEQLIEKPFNLSDYEVKSLPEPQLYTFQIKGYEETHLEIALYGLGIVNAQNEFSGILAYQHDNENLTKDIYIETVTKPEESNTDIKKTAEHIMESCFMYKGEIDDNSAYPVISLPITNIRSMTEPQLYKFQIKGNEISHPESFAIGLGTINDKNQFSGSIKHSNNSRDLSEKPDFTEAHNRNAFNSILVDNFIVSTVNLPITNISQRYLHSQGASIMESAQTPVNPVNTNIFKGNEQQVHNTVDETKQTVIDNINKLEYYKGYAKGMNGLIEKLQTSTSLEIVIAEVQMLTNQYNNLAKLDDYTPSFPDKQENPRNLQGQITGITDGVQTLRGIDITKYIENAPAPTTQSIPEYPALSKEEQKEYSDFITVMQKNYPAANVENLNKLCIIANDMSRHTFQDSEGTITTERFNTLTDHQEKQVQELIKDLPGVKVKLDYEPRGTAIKFELPQGQTNNTSAGAYNVPEIPANKLAVKKTNEFVSPFSNTTAKAQTR